LSESLLAWLAGAGLRNMPLEEMIDGFARRLNQAGVPLARIFVAMNTLHPMVLARALTWDRIKGPATLSEFPHAEIDSPTVQESPFRTMMFKRMSDWRFDLRQPPEPDESPVFAELRELGMTDWLGNVFAFGELGVGRARPPPHQRGAPQCVGPAQGAQRAPGVG
jgi:adenylate cyclase